MNRITLANGDWLQIEDSGLLRFRIYDVPQPMPKKDVAIVKMGDRQRLVPVEHDYRTRKNPITGLIEKYDRGYMRRWFDHVSRSVWELMDIAKIEPFKKNQALCWGCLVYVEKAGSNTMAVPAQAPDEDNYDYGIRNCLKRTPSKLDRKTKQRKDGKYPHGVLFYEDDAICWRIKPSGKLWATPVEPPGVLLSVAPLSFAQEEISKWIAEPTLRLGL